MYSPSIALTPADLVREPNIAALLPVDDQQAIAGRTHSDFQLDKASRREWEENMSHALSLSLLLREAKSFPWPQSSNVKFPLVTVAALQHHALIYPALVPQSDLVKCRVIGPDAEGRKFDRATRIQEHMSYQMLEEDEEWEADTDRALIVQPILGCAFKKTYWSREKGHVISRFVSPADLYIPYFARSLEESPRITHVLAEDRNAILGKMREEVFLEHDLVGTVYSMEDRLRREALQAQGLLPSGADDDEPIQLLEQHRWLDLDGDGLAEPYIVTIRQDTQELYRIVARYSEKSIQRRGDGEIIRIEADHYFTKYPFIPSPDGGIYDLGWGILLAPLSEAIDSIINQCIDAGTVSILAGGFLGRGARLKAGDNQFRPGEWKMTQGVSDDLRKHIYPYPGKDIPPFMFNLLSLMINYGERLVGATDTTVGENPGQNTPAETSRTMVREARKVYNGVYKRTWRALRDEMRKIFRLNSYFLPATGPADYAGEIARIDYSLSPKAVVPAADPQMLSDTEQAQIALALKQNAMQTPGYDLPAVERRFLRALRVSNPNEVYRPTEIQPTPSPAAQAAQLKLQIAQLDAQVKVRTTMAKLLAEVDMTQAKIRNLESQTQLNLANASAVDGNQKIALMNAQIGAAKAHQEGLLRAIELLQGQLQSMPMAEGIESGPPEQAMEDGTDGPALPSPGGSVGDMAAAA